MPTFDDVKERVLRTPPAWTSRVQCGPQPHLTAQDRLTVDRLHQMMARSQFAARSPGGFVPPSPRPLPCRELGGEAIGFVNQRLCLYDGRAWDRCLPNHFKCLDSTDDDVRSCLDCPAHLPVWPFSPHPEMSPRSVREYLNHGDPVGWPRDWVKWSKVRAIMLDLAREAIAATPPCPEGLSGRGILTCGGGKYDASLYVQVSMLRAVGSSLPVEIWHDGSREPVSDLVRGLPGVTVRDLGDVPARRRGGWCNKTLAMEACLTAGSRWSEFIFLDADTYPVTDPAACFEANPTGCVLFPDRTWADGFIQRPSYGGSIDWSLAPPPICGGQYVFRFPECWPLLQLAKHYDQYSEFWYAFQVGVGGFGDQDQMRAAVAQTRTPFRLYAESCGFHRGVFSYAGPDGETLFLHRAGCKFALPGQFPDSPIRSDGLPMEAEAWRFFETWKDANSPVPGEDLPVPGRYSEPKAPLARPEAPDDPGETVFT